MRVSGVLVGIGIVLIAMSGLVEGAALVRYVQDEPQLLLPLPCDQSLPVLIGTRLRLQALTDGVDHPMEVTVQWLARDGNGVVLGQGTTAVTPGHDSLLGVVPSGNRRELHLLAQVVRGTPRQAWLRVRPDAVSAATLALGGIALFVVGELALGLGTVLSVWRLFWRFAQPIQQWWRRWIKRFTTHKRAKRRSKGGIDPEEDLETKADLSSQTDTQAETAIPSDEEDAAGAEQNPLTAPRHGTRPGERATTARSADGQARPRSASTSISHDAVQPDPPAPTTTRRRKRQ